MNGIGSTLYRYRGPLYYVMAVLLLVAALGSAFVDRDPAGRTFAVLTPIALVGLLAVMAAAVLGGRRLAVGETRVVTSPVGGRWVALNSPATKVPSHGVRMYGQAYAIDLVHEPEPASRPVFGDGPAMRASEEYPAFGQPVLAMIDGVVVRASARRRDHRARSTMLSVAYLMVEGAVRELGGPGFILGNHVTIQGDDGVFATVAHLQRGSLMVKRGDTVRAGDRIGLCGNSGNTSEPHVHAQLMDRAATWTGQGVPMVFGGIRLDDDTTPVDGLPANGVSMTAG